MLTKVLVLNISVNSHVFNNGLDYEEDTEVDIERSCYNCEYQGYRDISKECRGCVVSSESFKNFVVRNDLVDLHEKLRKAVEAIEFIGEYCGDAVFEREDGDDNWYSVNLSEYTKEVLEGLQ